MILSFGVYFRAPGKRPQEEALTQRVAGLGGRLDHREAPQSETSGAICLTFEFDVRDQADAAAQVLREQGEHVEGPMEYGNSS
jgi:hypothetical protein